MMRMFFFILLALCFIPSPAQAQVFCKTGQKACESVIRDGPKYVECVKNICEPLAAKRKAEAEAKKPKQPRTCNNGLRRCDVLRKNAGAYWLCMEETCNDPELSTIAPSCIEGQQQCTRPLKSYRSCVNLVCRNPRGNFNECEEGKRQCEVSLDNYWNCVFGVCIGDTQPFIERAAKGEALKNKEQQQRIDEIRGFSVKYIEGREFRYNNDGELIAPLLGVPNRLRYPNDEVTPEDYRMTMLPTQRITFAPSLHLECLGPLNRLHCLTQDISSCVCTDGAQPVRKKQTPIVFEEEPPQPDITNIPPIYYNARTQEDFERALKPVSEAIKRELNYLKRMRAAKQLKEKNKNNSSR